MHYTVSLRGLQWRRTAASKYCIKSESQFKAWQVLIREKRTATPIGIQTGCFGCRFTLSPLQSNRRKSVNTTQKRTTTPVEISDEEKGQTANDKERAVSKQTHWPEGLRITGWWVRRKKVIEVQPQKNRNGWHRCPKDRSWSDWVNLSRSSQRAHLHLPISEAMNMEKTESLEKRVSITPIEYERREKHPNYITVPEQSSERNMFDGLQHGGGVWFERGIVPATTAVPLPVDLYACYRRHLLLSYILTS